MTTRIVVLLLLFSTTVEAGTIRGTVTTPTARPAAPPRYIERPTSPAEHQGDRVASASLAAVIVEPVEVDEAVHTAPVADTPRVMAQKGTRFVPNLLIVPVGGVVSFPNHDPIFHNVFSYSSVKTFDLGRYPKGETRTVTFTEPGIVRVFCEIHASMYAAIVITESPWHQLIPSGSEFEFTDLPAGRYRLLAADAMGRYTTTDITLESSDTRSVTLALER